MEENDSNVKEPDAIINYQGTYAESRIDLDEDGNPKKENNLVAKIIVAILIVAFCFPILSFIFMYGLISVVIENDQVIFAVLKYAECWVVGFTLLFMFLFFVRKKGVYLVFFIITFGILTIPRLFITVKDYGSFEPITLMRMEIPTVNNVSDSMQTAFSFKYKGSVSGGHKGELVTILFVEPIGTSTINEYAAYMEKLGYTARAVQTGDLVVEATKYNKENNVATIVEISNNYITYMTVKMDQEEFDRYVIINTDR